MDPARATGEGVKHLRAYLEYAASGGKNQTQSAATSVPLNDFEQTVCDALRDRGFKILPEWGASKYRIDLVAQHPDQPGRFVLAIECDGATYHSCATARDTPPGDRWKGWGLYVKTGAEAPVRFDRLSADSRKSGCGGAQPAVLAAVERRGVNHRRARTNA
jgi:hypothetical protein